MTTTSDATIAIKSTAFLRFLCGYFDFNTINSHVGRAFCKYICTTATVFFVYLLKSTYVYDSTTYLHLQERTSPTDNDYHWMTAETIPITRSAVFFNLKGFSRFFFRYRASTFFLTEQTTYATLQQGIFTIIPQSPWKWKKNLHHFTYSRSNNWNVFISFHASCNNNEMLILFSVYLKRCILRSIWFSCFSSFF